MNYAIRYTQNDIRNTQYDIRTTLVSLSCLGVVADEAGSFSEGGSALICV